MFSVSLIHLLLNWLHLRLRRHTRISAFFKATCGINIISTIFPVSEDIAHALRLRSLFQILDSWWIIYILLILHSGSVLSSIVN